MCRQTRYAIESGEANPLGHTELRISRLEQARAMIKGVHLLYWWRTGQFLLPCRILRLRPTRPRFRGNGFIKENRTSMHGIETITETAQFRKIST